MRKHMNKEEIIIVDAYIDNEINNQKLKNFIKQIKKLEIPILIISNTIIDKEIIEEIEYFIYDHENRLFDDNFEDFEKFILWEIIGNYKFNTYHFHKQKHALSVLVNLFNSLKYVESLGYKYFHRIEYDTELGNKTIERIKETNEILKKKEKKGSFVLNNQEKTHTFQYFYCEISHFKKIIPVIRNQEDYKKLIKKFYNNTEFVILEKIMYKLLECDDSIEKIGRDDWPFDDSYWNTSSSTAHLQSYEKKCRTSYYRGLNNDIIFSKNNTSLPIERKIILKSNNSIVDELMHRIVGFTYFYNYIPKNIDQIIIIENEEILDIIDPKNEENNFQII